MYVNVSIIIQICFWKAWSLLTAKLDFWTCFFVYFKLDFYCLCSLQKSGLQLSIIKIVIDKFSKSKEAIATFISIATCGFYVEAKRTNLLIGRTSLARSIQMSMNGGIKILRVNFSAKMDIQGIIFTQKMTSKLENWPKSNCSQQFKNHKSNPKSHNKCQNISQNISNSVFFKKLIWIALT